VRLVLLFLLAKQPREALHEASPDGHAEQDGAPHLLARRELREALGDGLGGNYYADLGALIVWHTGGGTSSW
jgi:hypothetical protein